MGTRAQDQICSVCGEQILGGQLVSGVQENPETYHYGHYACVRKALGPEKSLKAIERGILPMVDVNTLVDGRLPEEDAALRANEEQGRIAILEP